MVMDAVLTKFEVLCGLERMWQEAFTKKFEVLCGLEQMIEDDVST
jgi:hypothetical protein